jgi:hypothetical protein
MSSWNSNDRESSKPSWLTEEQKRVCFRTVRGWEIPLVGVGVTGTTANPFNKAYVTNSATNVVPTELLVAMPLDPSPTGVPQTNYTNRGITQGIPNSTTGNATGNFNYAPYFTIPVQGDYFRVSFGTTSFIPVIVSDANTTEFGTQFSMSLTGPTTAFNQMQFISSITAGTTAAIGPAFYWPSGYTSSVYPFGGWGGITLGAGVLRLNAGLTTGTHGMTFSAFDGRSGVGLTGTAFFQIRVI